MGYNSPLTEENRLTVASFLQYSLYWEVAPWNGFTF